jgi:hypothetical protein
VVAGEDASVLHLGSFSTQEPGGIPTAWQPLPLRNVNRATDYRLVRDGDTVVLRAASKAAASGLIRRVNVAAADYPLLRWRWKISASLHKADARRKDADDFAARIYVTFQYDPQRLGFFDRAKYEAARVLYGEYPPHSALTYVWDNRLPIGSELASAYTDRVRIIVVQSGDARAGTWVEQERDLLADYRRAFGDDPPPLAGVAVMTDTDNTGESALAFYGDITLAKR